jgi:hypothetical protein
MELGGLLSVGLSGPASAPFALPRLWNRIFCFIKGLKYFFQLWPPIAIGATRA